MTVGHAIWPDQLSAGERASLSPGVPSGLDQSPDVLVIGGGMVGCATAAACLRAGLSSVVLLEKETLGSGASGGAAGLLLPESHVGIDPPEFVELMRLGLAEWHDLEATWPGGVGLMPTTWQGHPQARVNPLRAIARLAAGLPYVATGVGAQAISKDAGRVRAVVTSAGEFTPRNVIFATGLPPRVDGLALDVPSTEVKGHMVVTAPAPLRRTEPDLARAIDDAGRLLIGGSLDVGDSSRVVRADVIASLIAEVETAWPEVAGRLTPEYTWACFRPAHPDHMPVIDRVPGLENAWFTSGHYKTGILVAPATGRALAEWLRSGTSPGAVRPFNVARFALPAA